MANFWTDFSEKTNGSLKGQGWTERWRDYDYTVVEDAGSTGGKHVEMRNNAQFEAGTSLISWDDIDGDVNRANAEILIRFRQNTGGNNIFFALARGANAYASRTGYMGTSQADNNYLTIERFVSGTYGVVNNETGITIDRDVWNWIRFRVNEGNLQAKIWADGSSEPETYQNVTTDGNVTDAGWVGFGVYGGGGSNVDIDVFSVGTDGDSATMENPVPEVSYYWTDFSEYTTNVQPSDWVKRWQTGMDFLVQEDVGAVGGKLLRSYSAGTLSTAVQYGLTWDVVNADVNRDDAEVLMKLRFLNVGGASQLYFPLIRGANVDHASRSSFAGTIQEGGNVAIIEKWVNGTYTDVTGTAPFTVNQNQWYWIRFRVNGDSLQQRVWADGDAEPSTWIREATDATIPDAGWIGLGTYQRNNDVEVDIFSVATGGGTATAEKPDVNKYDEFTIPNPASDLDNVVLGFNLADNMSVDWWSEVDTTDGTKLRVYKEDGTELPFDIVGFDDVAETGFLWVRWDGTITSAGTQKIRIAPAKTTNVSYGVADTFGRHATWVDYAHVYHMNQDPSGTEPQLVDSTGNSTGTTSGAMTSGDLVDMFLGKAIVFDGADDKIVMNQVIAPPNDELVIQVWVRMDANDLQFIFGEHGGNASVSYSGSDYFYFWCNNSLTTGAIVGIPAVLGNWYKVTGVQEIGNQRIYINGAVEGEQTNIGTIDTTQVDDAILMGHLFDTGSGSRNLEGAIAEAWMRYSAIGANQEAYEHNNQVDMATFWGVGTWVDGNRGIGSISGNGELNGLGSVLAQSIGTISGGGELNGSGKSIQQGIGSISGGGELNGVGDAPVEPQTYSTDFSEYTSDQAPSNWTKRWQDMDFIVRDNNDASSGKLLKAEPNVNSVNNTIHAISWDIIDADANRADVEILMKFRHNNPSGQQSAWAIGRGQGTLFADKEGYASAHYENLEYDVVGKWVNGASWDEIVVETGVTQEIDVWYYKRFRIEGNQLKSKIWQVGTVEPVTWDIETTDNDITDAGWVGIGVDEDPAGLEVDYFSVATGGGVALVPTAGIGSISGNGELNGLGEEPIVPPSEGVGTISGNGELNGIGKWRIDLQQPTDEQVDVLQPVTFLWTYVDATQDTIYRVKISTSEINFDDNIVEEVYTDQTTIDVLLDYDVPLYWSVEAGTASTTFDETFDPTFGNYTRIDHSDIWSFTPVLLTLGIGSISGNGELNGLGLIITQATGSISGNGELNGLGEEPIVQPNVGVGTISGGGNLTGIAISTLDDENLVHNWDANENNIVIRTIGDGIISGGGELNGLGEAPIVEPTVGFGTISGNGELNGSGKSIRQATGSISGNGELVGDGHTPIIGQKRGRGGISGQGTLNGLGKAIRQATGSISGGGELNGLGEEPIVEPTVGVGTISGGGELNGLGKTIRKGVATISGNGELNGIGKSLSQSTGSISGGGELNGLGKTIRQATGSISGGGELNGSGKSVRQAIGSISGGGELNGSGLIITKATGSISGGGTLNANGKTIRQATGSISGGGELNGRGKMSILGAGEIHGGGELNGLGLAHTMGVGTLSGNGELNGSGRIVTRATGSISGGGELNGDGGVNRRAIGSISGGGELNANGLIITKAVGSISGNGELNGHGYIFTRGISEISGGGTILGVTKRSGNRKFIKVDGQKTIVRTSF